MKPAISLALWPRFVHRALRRAFFAGIVTASLATSAAPSGLPTNHPLNKQAPDFALTGLNGQMLRLSGFRGKVVLLNFWATWCAPCQAEMPVFAAWQHRDAPRGFQVIGISMDDDAASARRLVERLKLNYPSALGDAQLAARYGGVLGLPLTFLIDRNGLVRARYQGETDVKTIESRVNALLAEP